MSTVSTIPLWGQAWELTVTYATANGGSKQVVITANSFNPEPLRMTFEVVQCAFSSPWWFADISIYNFNQATEVNTLFNATWAELKAGFQTGPNFYSQIWSGPVFQVLVDREDVVDQRVTLHCIANPLVMDSIINFSAGQFSSQQQIVARMVESIGLPPINPANGTQGALANQLMTQKVFPRGKTCFGRVGKYLEQIANDQLMATFRDGEKAYIGELHNPNLKPTITYCPPLSPGVQPNTLPPGVTASVLGTPKQTPFGVIFEVLLDPRVRVQMPIMVVALDRSTVFSQIPIIPQPSPGNVATPFTDSLSFLVSQVRHTGDTRGNDWQTEITGYSTTYADQLIDGIFAANSAGV